MTSHQTHRAHLGLLTAVIGVMLAGPMTGSVWAQQQEHWQPFSPVCARAIVNTITVQFCALVQIPVAPPVLPACIASAVVTVAGAYGDNTLGGIACGDRFNTCAAFATEPLPGTGLFTGSCTVKVTGFLPMKCLPGDNAPNPGGFVVVCHYGDP